MEGTYLVPLFIFLVAVASNRRRHLFRRPRGKLLVVCGWHILRESRPVVCELLCGILLGLRRKFYMHILYIGARPGSARPDRVLAVPSRPLPERNRPTRMWPMWTWNLCE